MKMKSSYKIFLIVIMSIFYGFGIELPVDEKTGKVTYTEVVQLDSSVTKSQIYTTAREWIATTFKSAKNVIQMDDKESGKIIAKGNLQLVGIVMHSLLRNGNSQCMGHMNFTLSIQAKDGRYKYILTDFVRESVSTGYPPTAIENVMASGLRKAVKEAIIVQTGEKARSLIVRLKDKMKTSSTGEDDW